MPFEYERDEDDLAVPVSAWDCSNLTPFQEQMLVADMVQEERMSKWYSEQRSE